MILMFLLHYNGCVKIIKNEMYSKQRFKYQYG